MLTPLSGQLSPLTRRVAGGYAAYVASLAPILWLRFRETSGTNAANSGSGGAVLDGTASSATPGQTGRLGANEALLFDGANSLVTIANNAALSSLTTQRWAFLCKPATLGEGTNGRFFAWGALSANRLSLASVNRIAVNLDASTDAIAITNTNQVDFLTKWAWVFMDYDDANVLGSGRRIRLFRGLSGAVAQLTLATDIAAVGALVAPAGNLSIGNYPSLTSTFDGPIDEVLVSSGLWTTAQMLALAQLSGV